MDIEEVWEQALKKTEIVRPRVQPLAVDSATELPYIFLAESAVNRGDTVVRKGSVWVERPSLILPPNSPQFEGFDQDELPNWDSFMNQFLYLRGVRFPSMRYNNKTDSLDVYEGRLEAARKHYLGELQSKENISTGLVLGLESSWQFSILIFIANQVLKQAEGDIQKLWNRFNPEK